MNFLILAIPAFASISGCLFVGVEIFNKHRASEQNIASAKKGKELLMPSHFPLLKKERYNPNNIDDMD